MSVCEPSGSDNKSDIEAVHPEFDDVTLNNNETAMHILQQMLNNLCSSQNSCELVFSSAFLQCDKEKIYSEATDLGLTAFYQGCEPDQVVIVRQQQKISQLVQHIRESGGETFQYLLIEPGGEFYLAYQYLA